MRRIKTEILQNNENLRLWVLDLWLEEDGVLRSYCYFGELEDEFLVKKLRHITEHIDDALHEFDKTVTKKLKDKNFRIVENGTHVPSRGLLNMLAPNNERKGKTGVRILRPEVKPVKAQEPPPTEHRRLKYD
jgi:hypothetical protein